MIYVYIQIKNTCNINCVWHLLYIYRSFDVIKQVCPAPYIPLAFLERVLQGFLFLLQDSGTGTIHDIHDEEFQDIKDGLEDCREQMADFQLDGTVCSSKASVS
jgi:hypothetical protein